MIICDTGPLVAAALSNDADHPACVKLFTDLHEAGTKALVPAMLNGTWFILGSMKEELIGDAEALEAIADEVEGGGGPVALVRPGHRPVMLVSAEEWQRLDELESAESTAWWRRDAAERLAATDEDVNEGEAEKGVDEGDFRRRFAYLFRSTGAA